MGDPSGNGHPLDSLLYQLGSGTATRQHEFRHRNQMMPRIRKLTIAAEILRVLAITGLVVLIAILIAIAGMVLADEVRDLTRLNPESEVPSQVEPELAEPVEIVVDDVLFW